MQNECENLKCGRNLVNYTHPNLSNFTVHTMLISAPNSQPRNSPYPIFAKRPANETHYYEIFNQPNATLIDLQSNPIRELTPSGLLTESVLHHLDILILATGFDAVYGGLRRHLCHRPRHVHYARAVLEERKVILPRPLCCRVPEHFLCLWPAVSGRQCAVPGRLDR